MTDADRFREIEELRKNQDNNGIKIDLKNFDFENPSQGKVEFLEFLSRNGYFILTHPRFNCLNNPHYFLLKKEEFFIYRTFEEKDVKIHIKETIKNIIGDFNGNFDEYFNYLFTNLKLIENKTLGEEPYYIGSYHLIGDEQITWYNEQIELEYILEKLRNETKIINENKVIQKKIQTFESTLDKKVDELNKMENNMKNSFLTFTGIFISIFTLITVNISIFNDGIKLNSGSKISMLLTIIFGINLSVVCSLYLMMELLRRVKYEEKNKSILSKNDFKFFVAPIIGLIIFGASFIWFNNPRETYSDKIYKVQNYLYENNKIDIIDGKIGKQTEKAIINLKEDFNMDKNIELTDEFLERLFDKKIK